MHQVSWSAKLNKDEVQMVFIQFCCQTINECTQPNNSFLSICVYIQSLQHILEYFGTTETPCWRYPSPPHIPAPPVTWLHGPTLQGVGGCSSVCCAICVENESIICVAMKKFEIKRNQTEGSPNFLNLLIWQYFIHLDLDSSAHKAEPNCHPRDRHTSAAKSIKLFLVLSTTVGTRGPRYTPSIGHPHAS